MQFCPRDGQVLLADPVAAQLEVELDPGESVGEYRIEARLGMGGFGTVYRAVQPLIDKQVAIKVLTRACSTNPATVSRFVSEARAVNQINHKNIVDIFSFGQLPDGRLYYVMELLVGEPLDHYLISRGRLTLAQALPILRGLARALDAAHQKGVLHRDLKPANVFVCEDDDGELYPKLLDFGIAKLIHEERVLHKTATGVALGTPHYMSPEQCRGRAVDAKTDIYSFGCLAYHILVGQPPFEAEEAVQLLYKQVNEAPIAPSKRCPDLPAEVDRVIFWLMAKNPDYRPPDAWSAVARLEAAPQVTIGPARHPRGVPRSVAQARTQGLDPWLEGPARPRRWPLALAIIAILGLVGVMVGYVAKGLLHHPAPPPPRTEPHAGGVAPRTEAPPAATPTDARPASPLSEPAVDVISPPFQPRATAGPPKGKPAVRPKGRRGEEGENVGKKDLDSLEEAFDPPR